MGEVHDFDAGDLGCGTGLPRAFAERMRSVAAGDVLRATVRNAAAREDRPALARMLGHRVQPVEDAPDGRLVISVERWEMSEKLLFNCTHGKEDAERATLPFVAANVAATADQEALVL